MSQDPKKLPTPRQEKEGTPDAEALGAMDADLDELSGDEPFDDFEAYAQLAAGARIHGGDRGPIAMKMRGNRDAGAGKKLNKPAHTNKRAP